MPRKKFETPCTFLVLGAWPGVQGKGGGRGEKTQAVPEDAEKCKEEGKEASEGNAGC